MKYIFYSVEWNPQYAGTRDLWAKRCHDSLVIVLWSIHQHVCLTRERERERESLRVRERRERARERERERERRDSERESQRERRQTYGGFVVSLVS